MILTEQHKIKKTQKNKALFEKIDGYCFKAKNLRNTTNYIIKQCRRISFKLKDGEILDSWEKKLIYDVNCGILKYNASRQNKKQIPYIDQNNGFIADAYFLSWYLKGTVEYKDMPSATCSQIVIQNICRDWKAYYKGMQAYQVKKETMLGKPKPPTYYDKNKGREWITLTNQKFTYEIKSGLLIFPNFLNGLNIKTSHQNNYLAQIRIKTQEDKIIVNILYDVQEFQNNFDKSKALSIDLGIDNLVTMVSNTDMQPVIFDGKKVKSINQYYNKRKSQLQEKAKTLNNSYSTKRLCRLSENRNNKVKDIMHKVSRKIVNMAFENRIGTIIVGNNQGWKQQVNLGKKTNQKFVSIPYNQLIQMIIYKSECAGIEVKVVGESYTSGTSYLDNELPMEKNYNKSRRITRGQFKSNNGVIINADVNAAYQIMKKVGNISTPIKVGEKVTQINVA